MPAIPVFEAKTRRSELLTQVQQGEEFTITRHGVPVARLTAWALPGAAVAQATGQRQSVGDVLAALAALRQGISLDLPLQDAIGAGRD